MEKFNKYGSKYDKSVTELWLVPISLKIRLLLNLPNSTKTNAKIFFQNFKKILLLVIFDKKLSFRIFSALKWPRNDKKVTNWVIFTQFRFVTNLSYFSLSFIK